MYRNNSGRASAKLSLWLAIIFACVFPAGIRWSHSGVQYAEAQNVNVTNTVTVTGTLTAAPTGTQTVVTQATVTVSPAPLLNETATGNITAAQTTSPQILPATCGVSIATAGYTSFSYQVTGTWVASMKAYASFDGTNYTQCPLVAGGGSVIGSVNTIPVTGNSITTNTQQGLVIPPGTTNVAIICTSYTSGTAVVTLTGTTAMSNFMGVSGDIGLTSTVTNTVVLGAGTAAIGHFNGATATHMTTATTTTCKSGAGVLHTITINTRGVTSTATVYDNTAGSGTIIAVLDTTLSTTAFTYDATFATGLTVVTTGGTPADLTITTYLHRFLGLPDGTFHRFLPYGRGMFGHSQN